MKKFTDILKEASIIPGMVSAEGKVNPKTEIFFPSDRKKYGGWAGRTAYVISVKGDKATVYFTDNGPNTKEIHDISKLELGLLSN